jgi:thiamine-phosphate pyrophosphorylase
MFSAPRRPLRYFISDGRGTLLQHVERLADSIDFVQIREPNLSGRELASLTRAVVAAAHPKVRVLVNDRADIALACGAHGVHLRSNAIAPSLLRGILPSGFLISVACHSVEDVGRAQQEGADMALLAPIFETTGKGPQLGLVELERAARGVHIPVLALGGITEADIPRCMSAGAAGIAGIRLFVA